MAMIINFSEAKKQKEMAMKRKGKYKTITLEEIRHKVFDHIYDKIQSEFDIENISFANNVLFNEREEDMKRFIKEVAEDFEVEISNEEEREMRFDEYDKIGSIWQFISFKVFEKRGSF